MSRLFFVAAQQFKSADLARIRSDFPTQPTHIVTGRGQFFKSIIEKLGWTAHPHYDLVWGVCDGEEGAESVEFLRPRAALIEALGNYPIGTIIVTRREQLIKLGLVHPAGPREVIYISSLQSILLCAPRTDALAPAC